MKIASIQLEVFNIPITVPYRLAYGLISETKQYLITIKLKNGLEGYGVGTADEHITGETDESLLHALQESKIEWIIGNSIEGIIFIYYLSLFNFSIVFSISFVVNKIVERGVPSE